MLGGLTFTGITMQKVFSTNAHNEIAKFLDRRSKLTDGLKDKNQLAANLNLGNLKSICFSVNSGSTNISSRTVRFNAFGDFLSKEIKEDEKELEEINLKLSAIYLLIKGNNNV